MTMPVTPNAGAEPEAIVVLLEGADGRVERREDHEQHHREPDEGERDTPIVPICERPDDADIAPVRGRAERVRD